ncbi:hypothetical protein E2562_021744 [Oryza meyeriana var. granulata]|uniref:Cullin family profile domain-containing protein n=1 Tax=Oryza meyeriana var. granulata TaxID=110450 RepID=A0A6G1E0Y7_9ORYZ|nr:hypothetical protein E2562_021744 [Oryza meyeriana var. granulata]
MDMKRPVVDLEVGWQVMLAGVAKLKSILDGDGVQFTPDEYMDLYTLIYNMCTQKPPNDYSQQLYERYKQALDDHIESTVFPSLNEKHGEFLLREMVQRWEKHKLMVRWLTRFFDYLDRYFVSRRSLDSLKDQGWSSFRDLVYHKLKNTVTTIVIAMIDDEREGKLIDRALLKNVLDIYVEIGVGKLDFYSDDFEQSFLKSTTDYYSKKAQTWFLQNSCPEYMLKAEECLQKEKDRVANYLHSSTEPKLFTNALFELITRRTEEILNKENSGCKVLLCDEKTEDLARMHRLFSRITGGLLPVSKIFQAHVSGEGLSLLKHATDAASSRKDEKKGMVGMPEQDFVRNVIELHDKYIAYVTNCFQGCTVFHKALKEAFEVFCNKDVAGCTSAELFAAYCDSILKRGGNEKLSDEAIDETLEKVVKLLTYVSDKDLFVEFHRKKLGRRLLFDRNINDEHERIILSKLKQFFGGPFTSKMEGMLKDITLAKEHQSKFEEYVSNNPESNPRVDLNVTVLTTGYWPTYKNSDINLPLEMVKCVEVFKKHYQSYNQHRKLTWIFSLGNCIVIGNFDAKPVEFVLNTYQAALLMLFNDADKLSYSEIVSQLKLSDDDAVRLLHSLSCAKYKILNKEPSNRLISTNDLFGYNSKFTDRMRRIKVPVPPIDEKKKVVEDVNKDRSFAIDASLVRIMKSRKVMGHQHLVAECVEQLSRMFKPDIKVIKRRIEDLISREYLERDSENANTYRYLA